MSHSLHGDLLFPPRPSDTFNDGVLDPPLTLEALRAGGTGCGPAAFSEDVLAASDIDPREHAAMTRVVEAFRTAYSVPGLSIAVAFRGRVVYEEAFGMADPQRGEPATPAHRFRIASVSKPVTACAIMDLVERGLLRLEDRVFGRGAVLGTDYGRAPYGANLEQITIEHLLTHTSGGKTIHPIRCSGSRRWASQT